MDHTKTRRVLTAVVGAGVLFVSACGSAENGSANPAPSSATAAPSASPTADSTPASSEDVSSAPVSDPSSPADSTASAPSDPTSSSPSSASGDTSESTAPSQTTDSSSSTSESEGVSVTDAAGLTVLAQQLGCTAPKVQAAKPGSEGAKAGATAVAQCKVDDTQYLLAATKNTAGVPGLIKSFSSAIAGGKNVFYVVGPTWFALGSKTGEDAPEDIAEAIQAKIGGEVNSTG